MRKAFYMRILSLITIFAHCSLINFAQNAYEIKANIKPFNKGHLYLAYHFGNKQYLIDSAKIEPSGDAVFTGTKKLQGGVYLIVFPEKNGWVECLIDKDLKLSLKADTSNLMQSMQFENSVDNTVFSQYQLKSFEIGTNINELRNKLTGKAGEPAFDSINNTIKQLGQTMQDYRLDIQQKYPNGLLTSIFNMLQEPEIPSADKHPKGKYDSVFAYNYYKDHFWDGIRFTDERLIRTPVLQGKFDKYYDQVLPQVPDSLIVYADRMLQASKPNEEMFKFMLSSLTDKYVNPKYMGQDAVFVHLFEKYFLAGDADGWMNEQYKKFVYDRGYSMMSNRIGLKAAELQMMDTLGKPFLLSAVQAPFTVICFWDPTCGHCKEEVPKMDSIFQAKWRKNGVKLIGVMVDGGKQNWLKFIKENKLSGWTHIYQTDEMKDKIYKAGKPGFRQLYDVYQTPMAYLLDNNKNIIAKKLNYLQMDEFMEAKKKSQQK